MIQMDLFSINGEYHLFYQFRPFYPVEGELKLVYWAHLKSDDMINWKICYRLHLHLVNGMKVMGVIQEVQ